MPVINGDSLATNIYAEIITEITRGNNTIIEHAIAAAMQEAKMYLSKFDLNILFGADPLVPDVEDNFLAGLIKDIACWRLVRLSNAGTDYPALRENYKDAIELLKSIMEGKMQPCGWKYASIAVEEPAVGDSISWSSNGKRENYY